MDAIDVEHVTPLVYKAMRVTADYLQPLFGLIEMGKSAHLFKAEPTPVHLADGSVGWQVIFRYDDDRPSKTAHPGYWVVANSELDIEVLDPPTGASRFHADVPFEWDTTPVASLNFDGSVLLVFRQPKSINGPWIYAVTRSDAARLSLTDVLVVPVRDDTERVIGADVHLTVPAAGMDVGVGYAFTVTATDSYGKTATTPDSTPLTIPPAPIPVDAA